MGSGVLSPALRSRRPQAVLGWKSWEPWQLGATQMAPFDLLQGLVMSPGGFSLKKAPAAHPGRVGNPGYGGPHPVFL